MILAAPWEPVAAFAAIPGLKHGFLLRVPGVRVGELEKREALALLQPHQEAALTEIGVGSWPRAEAEQVHGAEIVEVTVEELQKRQASYAGVDGFLTREAGVSLVIYVADCAAVYLVDPITRSIGLLHSGKKGTELRITERAIENMMQRFGTEPSALQVAISPCIRPPDYEVDFASDIRAQAYRCGIPESQVHDSGVSTASDLERFYSYRLERGKTGRLLAVLGWSA
ncbi:MAG: polyphenol oxidase family protein [Verrucomicrobiota bacterium]